MLAALTDPWPVSESEASPGMTTFLPDDGTFTERLGLARVVEEEGA